MPLSLPNLDDRTYDDLVREALAMIPVVAPAWTNHNASDPGITLVELLAYLVEILVYRTNQISDPHLAVFVSLLTGQPHRKDRPLAEQVRDAVLGIRRISEAVTAEDYEKLALASAPGQLARAHCLPGHNLTIKVQDRQRPGHISLVVVPFRKTNERHPRPTPELLAEVRRALEDYRLVTTRLHVVGPHYVPVKISATMALTRNVPEREVGNNVRAALERFLEVVADPPEEGGWPFGKDVYVSELYDVIERQPGVDYVAALELTAEEESRLVRNAKGEVVAIDLRENELPLAEIKDVWTRAPLGNAGHRGAVNAE